MADEGTCVTAVDLTNGEEQTVTIVDDYVVITDGSCRVAHVAIYHSTGTCVVTIKKERRDG